MAPAGSDVHGNAGPIRRSRSSHAGVRIAEFCNPVAWKSKRERVYLGTVSVPHADGRRPAERPTRSWSRRPALRGHSAAPCADLLIPSGTPRRSSSRGRPEPGEGKGAERYPCGKLRSRRVDWTSTTTDCRAAYGASRCRGRRPQRGRIRARCGLGRWLGAERRGVPTTGSIKGRRARCPGIRCGLATSRLWPRW